MYGIFPGARLGARRTASTVPLVLVWCWHPKSNLDPNKSWHCRWNGCFYLFCCPQPKPGPYFMARYAGAMGIKRLVQLGHNSKAQIGIKLLTLGWELETTTISYTKLLPPTHTHTHTHTHLSPTLWPSSNYNFDRNCYNVTYI